MADEKDLEGDEKPAGKKKLLIIIGIVVFLLINAGVVAWLMMGDDSEEPAEAKPEDAAEVVEREGPAIYHSMEPMFVVNLPPGGRAKMLQVGVDLLTYDPKVDEFLTQHDPMLRHHLFNLFGSQDANALFDRAGREALQVQVKALLEKEMKGQGIEAQLDGVFFNQFVLQ